jgi:hypothetical protein
MPKLIFAVVCSALIFAGYRAEIGTGSVARGDSEGSYAKARRLASRVQQRTHKILDIGTLIALAIVADGSPLRSDCAASVDVITRDDNPGSPAHRYSIPWSAC